MNDVQPKIRHKGGFASGAIRRKAPRMFSQASHHAAVGGSSGDRRCSRANSELIARLPEQRRGVLLLIALIMLALFMLLGTSYILIANRRRPCTAAAGATGSKAESAANDTVNQASDDILTGRPDGASNGGTVGATVRSRVEKYFWNSLLTDKYGDIYEESTLVAIRPITVTGGIAEIRPSAATGGVAPSTPFFSIETTGAYSYGPEVTVANWRTANGNANPDLGSYVGRILSIESESEPNAAFRILARMGSTYIAHLVNLDAEFDYRNLTNNSTVTIQGREFSGGNPRDLHENHDAPDNQNLFMAWVPSEATLGRDQMPGTGDEPADPHRYVIPSFHRPDNLTKLLKSDTSNFYTVWTATSAIAMLRPAGQMSWDPSIDWQKTYGISAPALPTGNALEHPNFTGGNVRTVGNNPRYFDPLHGPWDVDNDGDGVTDSVWIDIGMPTVDIGNAQVQPLVAMMILDLDGRVNLNAHGNDIPFNRAAVRPAPAAGVLGYRYAGTVSSTTSGTAGPQAASLPHAQGWGVADIAPLDLFGVDVMRLLSRGATFTGSSTTPSGVAFPGIKAEGRFGDSAGGLGGLSDLSPAPGLLRIADPGVDAMGSLPRDNHIPNRYAMASGSDEELARAPSLMAPVDTHGTITIGLDQFGQPFVSQLRSASWPSRMRRVVPVVRGQPIELPMWESDRIDDPYDVSLGRNAPRPGWSFDPDVQGSPSTLQDNLFTAPQFERLLRMFEAGSEKLSPRLVSLLGESADVARVATTIESWDTTAVTIPFNRLEPFLALSDQANQGRDSLVSWDLAVGIRMNVNRPFGDGIDNDSDGIADEPGEYEAEIAANTFGMNGSAFANQCLTNGRDVDRDGDVDFDDQKRCRELFARHLYVLARTMARSVPAKEAAQWAVNVVDMRDPDSIITRFNYDSNCPAALDTSYPDPDGRVTSTWSPAPDDVVWGCERPELLITEAMAWRNIRTGTNSTGPTPVLEYTDKGTGGLVIELFDPWTGVTERGALASGLPAEFQPTPTGTSAFSGQTKIDLAKINSSGDPVFQLVAVYETGTSGTTGTLGNLAANPAWPQLTGSNATGTIDGLVIYPAKISGTAVKVTGTLGTFVSRDGPNVDATTIKPGQFAILSGPIASGSSSTLANAIDISATGTTAMTFNYSGFSDSNSGQVLQFTTGITETITGSNGFSPNDRSSGAQYPLNGDKGPVGALVCVQKASGPAGELRFPVLSGTMTSTPQVALAMESQKYRLLLRRLANPLEPHNASLNPYICIDSLVVQDQAVIANDPTVITPLRSAERCANQKADKSVNNLWRHASDDDNANVLPSLVSGTGVNASLGFLPFRLKIPSDNDEVLEAEQPVFPWLTWLNREFVSPHELLLVPKSSPATLLRDHSHEWPFKHLFFQLGSGTSTAEKDLEQNKAGILELLCVPSRFADSETRIPPADAIAVSGTLVAAGGRPMFLPPHNYLSHFREPGRINLNTMSSSKVWAAMNNGRPGAPYEDEVAYQNNGTPTNFEKSEDWRLDAGGRSNPLSGNWQVDNPEEDVNGNGRLDVNHDENNDGKRQVSMSGALKSIACSRRGWPLSVDGSTPSIAGQFDRTLNRKGLAADQLWFSAPFQSGWLAATGTTVNYAADRSLMLRSWTSDESGNFVRIANRASYRWLRRVSPVSLTGGEQYVCTIRFKGDVTLAAGGSDKLPELIIGGGPAMLDPSPAPQRSTSDGVTTYTATLVSLTGGNHTLQVAINSPGQFDVLSVSLTSSVTGGELLTNTDFSAGLTDWYLAPTDGSLETDATVVASGPTYLMATNLALQDSKGKKQDGRPYADPRRNPYFRYREMMRLSNLATSRSNVFAVWTTVGFFVVEPHPTLPNQTALGAEYGLDTGDNVRFKSFMIIDRSIPVGFRPGVPLNSRDTVILDHFGN
jgi:hypothetical protein